MYEITRMESKSVEGGGVSFWEGVGILSCGLGGFLLGGPLAAGGAGAVCTLVAQAD